MRVKTQQKSMSIPRTKRFDERIIKHCLSSIRTAKGTLKLLEKVVELQQILPSLRKTRLALMAASFL